MTGQENMRRWTLSNYDFLKLKTEPEVTPIVADIVMVAAVISGSGDDKQISAVNRKIWDTVGSQLQEGKMVVLLVDRTKLNVNSLHLSPEDIEFITQQLRNPNVVLYLSVDGTSVLPNLTVATYSARMGRVAREIPEKTFRFVTAAETSPIVKHVIEQLKAAKEPKEVDLPAVVSAFSSGQNPK